MSVQIYNTLTKKKEDLPKGNIKMYTCGVTVYDVCHIGHARSLYIFDVIVRYLKYRGYKVKFVRNITDIDDKIINKAKELNLSAKEVAEKYTKGYYEDLKALGIGKADFEPKATENIPDMIKHIQGLIKKGYAYVLDGDVYFSVRKFKDYGKLSGQNLEQMMIGARIEKDDRKQDPLDFALWKKSKEGEPSWKSPWGEGRPGWHIECSVMSLKYLKTKTLDIHAGGLDLVFPHHENEIAQAEALTGKPFSKFWIHHGLLTINGKKMAKSLGNFITIKDVLDKYPVEVLKIFYLQSHYSSSIDFSWEKMEEAKKALERITILAAKVEERQLPKTAKKTPQVGELKNKFIEAMDDNFNTSKALGVIFDLVGLANKNLDDPNLISEIKQLLLEFLRVFGLPLKVEFSQTFEITGEVVPQIFEHEIESHIKDRNLARQNKDYALADKIRINLEEKGIILEDTKEGTTWRRKL